MKDISPLTVSEYNELKGFLSELGAWLPENKATYVWSNYLKLNGHTEPQPCTCPSSGKHWKKAIDFLRDWIEQREK